ncbi:MAG: hypothetical protein ABR992_04590, partial [Solirubrobacteraceae bacterium]
STASAIQRRRSALAACVGVLSWLSKAVIGVLQGCVEYTITSIILLTGMICEKLVIAANVMIGA